MLLLIFSILVTSTPLASVYLSSIFFHRIAFLILILDGLLSYNTLYETPLLLSSWVHLLGGLLQLIQSQSLAINDIFLSTFLPVMVYLNADTDKSNILADNKGKAGIYLWKHKELEKMYIGSAVNLSLRLSYYYSPSGLKIADNYISRAIILHTHEAFSLSILEYIDISNLSKEEARQLILSREQFYLDTLQPEYNILRVAGNNLGYKHIEETLAKMSEIKSGKTHSAETKAKMSEAHKGKFHSAETKIKMSLAQSGENHPMYGYSFN
jgi:group I intron endonuclease